MYQILGLLGVYFNALVVFFTNFSLLSRLAIAILCKAQNHKDSNFQSCSNTSFLKNKNFITSPQLANNRIAEDALFAPLLLQRLESAALISGHEPLYSKV